MLDDYITELNNDPEIRRVIDLENRSLRLEKLYSVIRQYGKMVNEESDFLEKYANDVVSCWSTTVDQLEQAINCFESLIKVERGKLYGKA